MSAEITGSTASLTLDVAILNAAEDALWATEAGFDPVMFAQVDRDQSGVLDDCEAIGFPVWQYSELGNHRDLAELHGRIYAMEGRESQRLVMRDPALTGVGWSQVTHPSDLQGTDGRSAWSGLSGAAVFQHGLLLGVVIEHHPRQGPSAVQIRPIDVIARADDPDSAALREALRLDTQNAFVWAQTRSSAADVPKKSPPPGRPLVEFTDPFTLEVHRAIDTGTPDLPLLPPYIERNHDAQLKAAVAKAAAGENAVAVLVGGSSTGKTRACWEAVHTATAQLGGWLLWNPLDADDAVNELAQVVPHTIIWLNNTQHYLLTPGRTEGDRVAAGLRRILRNPAQRPVLILGTIWHDYWATLTTPPGDGEADPYANARALLSSSGISVPDTFSVADQRALHVVSSSDSRLAVAEREAEDGRVAQYLAAAPALLERYHTARPAARALIEAAIDARRLGHGPDLPIAMLEAAAPGYLTETQWDSLNDNWLSDALTYATTLCVGATGVFTKPRPRPGKAPLAAPIYRLADFLEQHGRLHRKATPPPSDLWDALTQHAQQQDLPALGEESKKRHLNQTAARIYTAAMRVGNQDAPRLVAQLLENAGYSADAVGFYEKAGEAGNPDDFVQAGRLLEDIGNDSKAIACYQRAAAAGRPDALWPAAALLKKLGRHDEAIDSYLRAADPPETGFIMERAQALTAQHHDDALMDMARHALGFSDFNKREFWRELKKLADYTVSGMAGFINNLGGLDSLSDSAKQFYEEVMNAGDSDELESLRASFDERFAGAEGYDFPGEPPLLRGYTPQGFSMRLASLLEPASGTAEGVAFYQKAATAGVGAYAMRWAAVQMAAQGRREEALEWLLERGTVGDMDALVEAADLLSQDDRIEEALTLYKQAADSGRLRASMAAASLLAKSGRVDEAMTLYQQLADTGDPDALCQFAALLGAEGRVDEALEYYEQAAQSIDSEPLVAAAALLGDKDRLDEAVEFYRRAAVISAETSSSEAIDLMVKAGDLMLRKARVSEAITCYEIVGQMGNREAATEGQVRAIGALDWLTNALTESGDLDGARQMRETVVSLYEHIAESGQPIGYEQVIERRRDLDQVDKAISWLQGIADSSDRADMPAMADAFTLMCESGRIDEAVEWLKRTAGASGSDAREQAADLLHEYGRTDALLAWLADLAEAEVGDALITASRVLRAAGRVDEAISYFEPIARAGNTLAWHVAARFLVTEGRIDEAVAWLDAVIADRPAGSSASEFLTLFALRASLHEHQGEFVLALAEYSLLLQLFGDMPMHEIPYAWDRARLLAKTGKAGEAIEFYQNAIDAGTEDALSRGVAALEESGCDEAAATWLLKRAEAGDVVALELAFTRLARLDRVDEAIAQYEREVQAGEPAALEQAAEQLASVDLIDQALTFYLRAAEVGRIRAFQHAVDLLKQKHRTSEAVQLDRLGIEPGARPSTPWNLAELQP